MTFLHELWLTLPDKAPYIMLALMAIGIVGAAWLMNRRGR